jgi:hypothetical protein
VTAERFVYAHRMIPSFRHVVPALLLLAALPFMAAEESYADKLKGTDQNNPEQVFALAKWCQENNQPSKARQHLFQVIKLDKDHAEARALLGQVKVGERWLSKSQLPGGGTQPTDSAEGKLAAGGKGPAANDAGWDLSVPKDPDPDNNFLTSYITRMSTAAHESHDMEVSISTLLIEENLASGLSRLCAAMSTPGFDDLYGPSNIVQGLLKAGRRADAQRLFGFIAQASQRVTDPDDLQAFCYAAGALKDKRALPRLIELMGSDKPDVVTAAGEAAGAITGLPRDNLTVEKVAAWWGSFHRLDEAQILAVQAKSKDPDTALGAATQLALLGDKSAIDVFITLMKVDDPKIAGKAHVQLTQFLGSDWGFNATDSKENRQKRLDLLQKWWKANKETVKLTIDPRLKKSSLAAASDAAGGNAGNPLALAVKQIGSANPKAALKAESDLIASGTAAVPHLIEGLSSADPITARKCHELLQRVSKKSDIAFNPRDPAETKRKAVAEWTAWASSQKLLPEDAAEEQGAEK